MSTWWNIYYFTLRILYTCNTVITIEWDIYDYIRRCNLIIIIIVQDLAYFSDPITNSVTPKVRLLWPHLNWCIMITRYGHKNYMKIARQCVHTPYSRCHSSSIESSWWHQMTSSMLHTSSYARAKDEAMARVRAMVNSNADDSNTKNLPIKFTRRSLRIIGGEH